MVTFLHFYIDHKNVIFPIYFQATFELTYANPFSSIFLVSWWLSNQSKTPVTSSHCLDFPRPWTVQRSTVKSSLYSCEHVVLLWAQTWCLPCTIDYREEKLDTHSVIYYWRKILQMKKHIQSYCRCCSENSSAQGSKIHTLYPEVEQKTQTEIICSPSSSNKMYEIY